MIRAAIISMLLPFAALAQQAVPKAPDSTKKPILIHYQKLVINYDHLMVEGKPSKSKIEVTEGDWNFGKDPAGRHTDKVALAAKNPGWDYGTYTADNVVINCPSYPVLKGDKLVMDIKTDKATLTGNITIIDHGAEKHIGEVMLLDFSDDKYKIEGIR